MNDYTKQKHVERLLKGETLFQVGDVVQLLDNYDEDPYYTKRHEKLKNTKKRIENYCKTDEKDYFTIQFTLDGIYFDERYFELVDPNESIH